MESPSRDEVDAKLAATEARVETRLVAIESTLRTQFAELRDELKAELHRSAADTIKWVAGIVFTAMALGLTVMTFVLNNAAALKS